MCEEDNAASVDTSASELGLIGGLRLRRDWAAQHDTRRDKLAR